MRIALTYNEKRSADEREAEFDTRATIEMLAARLRPHDVVPVEVGGAVASLIARLERVSPDVVFDIAEGERGAFREAFYPALFEQLGLAYTGSSPSTRALCLDKRLATRVVSAAGVRVPSDWPLEPPLIVKPNFEGSSKGITRDSIVRHAAELAPAIRACLAAYPEGALVEPLITGRDVSIAWIDGLGWLPAIAYHFDAPIYDYTLKHVTPERVRVEYGIADDRLLAAARRAFAALGVIGYGRADFRITPEGEPVFIELNPLPSLADGELFAAARAIGASPEAVLACIVRSARARAPCAA